MAKHLIGAIAGLVTACLWFGATVAAPITGENQAAPAATAPADPGSGTPQPTAAPTPASPFGSSEATVIEFSIVPSPSDPSQTVTIVGVQQTGGKQVCVNQTNNDIITRAYRPRANELFAPAVPSELRGLISGHRGEVVGLSESKIFIRPHSDSDIFPIADECFLVSGLEACFVPDEDDCDEELAQGDFVCVGDAITRAGCPLLDHSNLSRELRILLALNQLPGEAPIITAADVARSPELAPPAGQTAVAGPGLPGGPAPAGPTFGSTFSGSGGGAAPTFVLVPNVIGMSLEQATATITGVGLVVGNVTIEGSQTGFRFEPLVRSAHAQGIPPAIAAVLQQFPPANTSVALGSAVDLVLSQAQADIPEPSTLALYGIGLGLLVLLMWYRRRRSA